MSFTSRTIRYGKTEIDYELLMMNRKSLEIAVHPNKSVVVKAPQTSTLEAIEQHVQKKARWITKQIKHFENFEPRTPLKQYVGGESHLYLGRNYRFKITPASQNSIELAGNYLLINSTDSHAEHIKKLLDNWYRQRAKEVFAEVYDAAWLSFNQSHLARPRLRIRDMKTRWGSCSIRGWITLNLQLIKAPRECIDYVIMHEFCHLIHHGHGKDFYQLLEQNMPDWKQHKHKLETSLA